MCMRGSNHNAVRQAEYAVYTCHIRALPFLILGQMLTKSSEAPALGRLNIIEPPSRRCDVVTSGDERIGSSDAAWDGNSIVESVNAACCSLERPYQPRAFSMSCSSC
jgi:hypothetical protein